MGKYFLTNDPIHTQISPVAGHPHSIITGGKENAVDDEGNGLKVFQKDVQVGKVCWRYIGTDKVKVYKAALDHELKERTFMVTVPNFRIREVYELEDSILVVISQSGE